MLHFTFLLNIVHRLPGIMKLFRMVISKRENNFSTISRRGGEIVVDIYTEQGCQN